MTSFTNKSVLNLLRNLPRLSISNLRNNDGAVKKVTSKKMIIYTALPLT